MYANAWPSEWNWPAVVSNKARRGGLPYRWRYTSVSVVQVVLGGFGMTIWTGLLILWSDIFVFCNRGGVLIEVYKGGVAADIDDGGRYKATPNGYYNMSFSLFLNHMESRRDRQRVGL